MTRTHSSREQHAGSSFNHIYGEQGGITPVPRMLDRKVNSSPRRPPTPAPWYRKYVRR